MADHELKDADISRGCRQNDPRAWHCLVRSYTPLVYRMALRMLKDRQAAEDAAQEVFILVHRAIASHDPTRPLAPWLARITYNECLKRLAKTRRSAEKELIIEQNDFADPDNAMSPESRVNRRQISQRIDHALDRLAAQDRAMILMRYREGFSDSEISHATRMPVGTVKTRLHRARGKLRKYLAPFFKEVFP
jgi:RNA polymerase sigma-70 factor, ECF subfamily